MVTLQKLRVGAMQILLSTEQSVLPLPICDVTDTVHFESAANDIISEIAENHLEEDNPIESMDIDDLMNASLSQNTTLDENDVPDLSEISQTNNLMGESTF